MVKTRIVLTGYKKGTLLESGYHNVKVPLQPVHASQLLFDCYKKESHLPISTTVELILYF